MIKILLAIMMAVSLAGIADAQSRRDRDRDNASSDNPLQMQMRRVSPREAARRAQREEEARAAAEDAEMAEDNAASAPQPQSNAINPRRGTQTPAPRPGRGTDTNAPQEPGDNEPAPDPSPGDGDGNGGGHPDAPFDPVETPFSSNADNDDNEAAAPVRVRRTGSQRMSGETVDGEPSGRDHRRARDRRRNSGEASERTRVRDNRTGDDDDGNDD